MCPALASAGSEENREKVLEGYEKLGTNLNIPNIDEMMSQIPEIFFTLRNEIVNLQKKVEDYGCLFREITENNEGKLISKKN